MSHGITFALIAVGAAAIAVWVDVRFPTWAPTEIVRLLMHTAAVTVATHTLIPTAFGLAGDSSVQNTIALFAVAFPCIVYAFLVGFWMIKLAQRALAGFR